MTSKVFVNIGLSLDGYMAPDGMTMANPPLLPEESWPMTRPHHHGNDAS